MSYVYGAVILRLIRFHLQPNHKVLCIVLLLIVLLHSSYSGKALQLGVCVFVSEKYLMFQSNEPDKKVEKFMKKCIVSSVNKTIGKHWQTIEWVRTQARGVPAKQAQIKTIHFGISTVAMRIANYGNCVWLEKRNDWVQFFVCRFGFFPEKMNCELAKNESHSNKKKRLKYLFNLHSLVVCTFFPRRTVKQFIYLFKNALVRLGSTKSGSNCSEIFSFATRTIETNLSSLSVRNEQQQEREKNSLERSAKILYLFTFSINFMCAFNRTLYDDDIHIASGECIVIRADRK